MSILPNFPMVSQLTTITGDGRPSENAQFDCVAASIDAACRYLLGQPENSVFNPDNFKDKAYGEAWKNNGTAAKDYVDFCKSLGIDLYAVQGNPGHLVDLTHQYLAENKPVIFTEPDPYVSNTLGWSHVCVFYQDGPGYITAMDPYIAKPVHRTDQEWIQLLLNNEIWILERLEEEVKLITISDPTVAAYFQQQDDHHWLCAKTGKTIRFAILDFYKSYCNRALCGLTYLGLPVSNEIPLDDKGNTKQHFELGVLFYDPQHLYDSRPGSSEPIYPAKLYSGPGQDPEIAVLEAQLKQPAGIDPVKVANFQQAAALQVHDLVTKAQTIESSLIVPLG